MFDPEHVGVGSGEEDDYLYALTLEAEKSTEAKADDVHVLPDDLENIVPGVFLAAILSSVDPSRLSGYDLVRYVQAQQRLVSHDQAGFYTGVGELAYAHDPYTTDRDVVPGEFASEEIQTALCRTRRSADHDLDLALDLRHRIPQITEALHDGRIDLARARVYARELAILDPTLIPDIVDATLPQAGELTTGQLRSRLQTAVLKADPKTAEDNYQAGLEDRRMISYPNPDHTATVSIQQVDPLRAITANRYVHQLALNQKRLPGESRSIDQIKADIAIDLLSGHAIDTTTTIEPNITIQVTDTEIRIPGYGPILPTNLPGLSEHVDVVNHENTDRGQPLDEDCHFTRRYRPTAAQTRHVRSHYPTCVFPGCRMPATQCDIDHRHPYSKVGKTTCANLAPLCRHHHICKEQTSWKLERNPNGSHTWTSPLGHTYTTHPTRPP